MLRTLFIAAGLLAVSSANAAAPECKRQDVEKSVVEMCLAKGDAFQHDTYLLKIDNVLVFALMDDYVENVSLEHTIPPGLTIELPLSKQGTKTVRISGGCVPESKDGAEVARTCNFSMGRYQIVKDVRFTFE